MIRRSSRVVTERIKFGGKTNRARHTMVEVALTLPPFYMGHCPGCLARPPDSQKKRTEVLESWRIFGYFLFFPNIF